MAGESTRVNPWGEFEVAAGTTGCWCIGPTRFAVINRGHEWLVGVGRGGDPSETAVAVDATASTSCLPPSAEYRRYGFGGAPTRLRVSPRLADRPVVSRPQTPLRIPPGQRMQLFVGSPVWVALEVDSVSLEEFPLVRPSDTWFGPVTQSGGLCYAASTRAVADVSQLSARPTRAVTPVLVDNRAGSMLVVERINLPVPLLSLYAGPDGRLWSEAVTLARDEGQGEEALLRIEKGAPAEANGAALLSPPRQSSARSPVVHAFNALFG